MMNKIDSLITSVENGLFAVLGNGPVKRNASPARTVRKAVKRPSKKVRKKRK
jgi:hypothetical protein